jgi:hypothetical protein
MTAEYDEALQLLSAAQPMLADVPQLGGEYLAGLLAALEDPARRAEFLAANEFDAGAGKRRAGVGCGADVSAMPTGSSARTVSRGPA